MFLRKCALIMIISLASLIVLSPSARSSAGEQEDSTKYTGKRLFKSHLRPAATLQYGFADYSLKDLRQSLSAPGVLEIRLGGQGEKVIKESSRICSYEYHYLSLADFSSELGSKSESKVNTSLWRFGATMDEGLGYLLGESDKGPALILSHAGGIHWSKLDVKDRVASPQDSSLLAPFDGHTRFGQMMEADIRFRIAPVVMINLGFERALIFPYHRFWKWVGSVALEIAVEEGLDEFVSAVRRSTAVAAPIVGFILKNGASYGIYELRKDKMNFPFKTAPPLLSDSFRFGLDFTF